MTSNWKVAPRGREDAPYVIVGDAPKQNELASGLALDNDTYDLLVDFLTEAGISYKDVVFVNATQVAKRGGTLSAKDIIEDAEANLLPFIKQHPRKIVVPLGNNALCATGVTKKPEKITSLKGTKCSSALLPEQLIVPAIHPYGVQKEPETVDELMYLFNYIARVAENPDAPDQAEIVIKDIIHPSQIKDLIAECQKNGYCAYDFETTGLDQFRDFPVTAAFCTGEQTDDGKMVVWFWAGFCALEPIYTDAELNAFIDEFAVMFKLAETDYGMVAWNKAFDDRMLETWIGEPYLGSPYDAMIMKWNVNSRRPHDLKNATAMYCGFSNYDKPVDDAVKEIAERRGKILSHEDDFRVLQLFGHTPKNAKTGFKWPDGVDKKLCAYALVPFDTLRLYNSFDSVYTYMLFKKFQKTIKREKLSQSCALRHRISYELIEIEKRGMLLDVEMNRQFSKELETVSNRCQVNIVNLLAEMGHDLPEFNPGSGDQLGEVLFGQPTEIPTISVDFLVDNFGFDERVAQDKANMVQTDFYGDCGWLKEQKKNKIYDYDDCAKKLVEAAYKKLNIRPAIEKSWVYIDGIHEPEVFTKTGKPSTANAILTSLYEKDKNPFLSLVLLKRKADKLKSTFVDAIYNKRGADNCVRASYNVIGTDSGRISSARPNAQNFGPFMRGQLRARPGYKFLEFDLSQAEIRAVAAYSGDEQLLLALSNEDVDVHSSIASVIYKCDPSQVTKEQRRFTKTIVFGIIYGRGSWALSIALGCSQEEAQDFIDLFFNTYPGLKNWLDEQIKIAGRPPYYVYTPWGTRRSTKNILSTDKKEVSHTRRIAQNMPIQGAAGELTLYYLCEIMDACREGNYGVFAVNTTHDSVALEVPEHLVWQKEVDNVNGKAVYSIEGPIADIVRKVINTPAPVAPLDKVKFKADMELNERWSGEPDLLRSIDPEKGGERSIFRWDIIKAEEVMDADELDEFNELLEMAGER